MKALPNNLEYESVTVTFRDQYGDVKGRARLDLADTVEKKRTGLMHRESLPFGRGMLFDSVGAYWMKDVKFPLDLVFVDDNDKITEIQLMDVHVEGEPYTFYTPTKGTPVMTIELPGNWCKKKGVKEGHYISITQRDE